MALHTDKRGFVYETRREDGRILRRYIGKAVDETVSSALALDGIERRVKARLEKLTREQRTREEEERHAWEAPLARLDAQTGALVASLLVSNGYHYTRGQWRKRREKTMSNSIQKTRALLERGRNGDLEAAGAFWREVDGDPARREALVKQNGDIAAIALNQLVGRIVDGDIIMAGGIRRQLDTMRQELSGSNPSPLELLLVERVCVCWLKLHYLEYLHITGMDSHSIKQSEELLKQVDSANKRYLNSIKTLAQIRKLQLPTVQVNIGEKQVNIGHMSGHG